MDTAITVGTDPRAVAFGDGFVWVANSGSNSISKIDPSNSAVVRDDRRGSRAARPRSSMGASSTW